MTGGRGETYAERFFRTWERDGRRNYQPKLALAWAEYDEQRTGRLGALDWEDHHATYADDYEWHHYDRDPGAWTTDADAQTIVALRERDIDVPEPDTLPLAISPNRQRRGEVGRECPSCASASLVSAREAERVYPPAERHTGMRIAIAADGVTHVCSYCRRVFWFNTPERDTETRDIGADLSEAM